MLDRLDRRILRELVANSRISLKDLAENVSLSSPSISERLRRLVERGVIRAFTVEIDPQALGYNFQAIVRIRPLPGNSNAVEKLIRKIPEVAECDKVTGDDCFVARLFLQSIEQLDGIVESIATKAQTSTAIVKIQPVRRRPPPLGQ